MRKTPAVLCAALSLYVAADVRGQKRPEPDLCAVPPGAQPLLPAKLLPGMGAPDSR